MRPWFDPERVNKPVQQSNRRAYTPTAALLTCSQDDMHAAVRPDRHAHLADF